MKRTTPNILRLAALGLLGALTIQPILAQRPLGIVLLDRALINSLDW